MSVIQLSEARESIKRGKNYLGFLANIRETLRLFNTHSWVPLHERRISLFAGRIWEGSEMRYVIVPQDSETRQGLTMLTLTPEQLKTLETRCRQLRESDEQKRK